jgi:hypothetical protein
VAQTSPESSSCSVPLTKFVDVYHNVGPLLWSSGQNSWLLTQRYRVRFPPLPDFLSGSESGTGSTQPLRGYMRSYLKEK